MKSKAETVTLWSKIIKYHWAVIGVALCVLVGVETAEFTFGISDTFHLGEIIIYFVLLGIVGYLVERVLHTNRVQQSTMNLLRYKHEFSLELMPYQNWDSLTNLLVRKLAEIMGAQAAALTLLDLSSNSLETIADWAEAGYTGKPIRWEDCQICLSEMHSESFTPHYCCEDSSSKQDQGETRSYCFPVFYKSRPYAILRFVLNPCHVMTADQQQILLNVSDEIIIALTTGMDRKRLSELELAEAALAERHSMSHYLHDNLGQNLGFLRMKLEQLIARPDGLEAENDPVAALHQMKDVVERSYQIVRNKLEISIPDSTPLLANYLQEHAKKVAQRSKIEISFTNQGDIKPVSVDLQRALFYVFQEALSNVEKHAHATKVRVLLNWEDGRVTISIADNGRGFRAQRVSPQKHFGLEIMRERMDAVGGSADIRSSAEWGTTVTISAPLQAIKNPVAVAHG